MVGWFIEHQNIGLLEHEFTEEQTGCLAAGEDLSPFIGIIAGKEHLAENAADFFGGGGRVPLMEPLQDFDTGLDESLVILGKVSYCCFMAPDNSAAVDERAVVAAGLAQLGFCSGGRIGEKGSD